jgi:hypothetical protein
MRGSPALSTAAISGLNGPIAKLCHHGPRRACASFGYLEGMPISRMFDLLKQLFVEPIPIRYFALRFLDRQLNLLGYAQKLRVGSIERPHYGCCMLEAAKLAAKLGHPAISVIEFGVAGGNG